MSVGTAAPSTAPNTLPAKWQRWSLLLAVVSGAKRLLIMVPMVLVPVLVFCLFNEAIGKIPDPVRRAEFRFDSAFLFGDGFLKQLSVIASQWLVIVGLFISMSSIASWIKLLGAASIVSGLENGKAEILRNARSIRIAKLVRFVIFHAVVYSAYLLAASLLYLALLSLYRRYGLAYTHYGLAFFALIIPFHIGLQAMYGLILTIGRNVAHEARLIRLAVRVRNLARLYGFFTLRVSIEAAIVFAVYFVLRQVVPDSALIAAAIAALLIPMAFLRVSSTLYQLALLENDPTAQQLARKSLWDR